MRLNSLCEVALNDQGRAIAPWLNDTTVGPYQRLIDAPSDTWQLVTRTDGVVTPVPGFKGGCHESCAGNNQWMRQLIGAEVPLAGSANWTPKNGYCGDIDGELALTMDAEQTTITVFRNGLQIGQFPRINPFMGIRLKGEIATWFEFDRLVNISARNVVSGEVVTVQALPGPQYSPIVFTSAIGERWVLYQTDAMGGVCHRINDKTQGYTFGTPQGIYDPDVIIKADGACVIGWAEDAGQYAPRTLTIPVLGAGMVPLKVPEPPLPELPIGPIGNGDPMPDGTEIDLNDYLMPDPQHFPAGDRDPRDTHGMHLWHLPNLDKPGHRFIWCAKFGKLGNGAVGEGLYLPEDPKGYIHFAIDASWAPEPGVVQRVETWNNTIWMPRTMRIGRKYGYIQDNDTLERRRRADCGLFDRVGWSEEIWIEKVWRKFHVGGGVIKSVVFLVSNNTGVREGQTTSDPGLYVETRHLVPGGYAWRQWTSYQAKKLFATGSADFSITPSATSKFWYPGGAVYPANPPKCIPTPTPAPTPTPIPPTPTPMPTDTLLPGQNILVDKPLVSQDKRFTFLYQRDGNLVHYGPNGAMWSSSTVGQSVGFVSLQGDGNFVVYNGATKPVWASNTNGKPVKQLLVQNDGNVVLYSATAPVWATGTVYSPPTPTPIPPIPPIPPGGSVPNMHSWPFFGASYATGPWRRDYDPALWAALNRDAGGNFTRYWLHDAWGVAPNGPGQHAGIQPWKRDSAGVFDLSVADTEWDNRLNQCVRIQNNAGAVVQLSVLNLYSWSTRKEGLQWVPDPNLGPFRRNRNGVYWADDSTFDRLPDWVVAQLLERACAAVKGLAVTFEVAGNEHPEKPVHVKMADMLQTHFTSDWRPDITCNRNEDTSGQYFNMAIGRDIQTGVHFYGIAYHGKDSLAYLDEVFEDEPSSRPDTFRKLWEQSWPEGKAEPKRVIMSSDGCRAGNGIEDCYNWPVLREVVKDHLRRGFTFEHQSRCKMRPFLENRLDIRADFEGDWLRSVQL